MGNTRRIRDAIVRDYPAINVEDSLSTAMHLMAEHNASALVVKKEDQLLGIVTITDVMFSLAANNDPAETTIGSFMTTCDLIAERGTRNPCAQLDVHQDALSAIKVMYEAGVHHLVVSGDKGEPVGIVSSLEIVKLLAES